MEMRTLQYHIFAVAALAASAAFGWTIHVPSMPVSPYADTEVSTNIPVNKADIMVECKM